MQKHTVFLIYVHVLMNKEPCMQSYNVVHGRKINKIAY